MAGLEPLAVVGCVSAICAAYHDGVELVRRIKARREAKRALWEDSEIDGSTQELEVSLVRGEGVVRSQFDRDVKRFGESFASGDQVARDALKDIIIHMQQQVISNLKIHWQQDTFVEFAALQDVSDSSQDRCILVLMQLQQRIITSGPTENLTPPPLNPSNAHSPNNALNRALPPPPTLPDVSQPTGRFMDSEPVSSSLSSGPPPIINRPQLYPGHAPLTPPTSPFQSYNNPRRISSQSSAGRLSSSEARSQSQQSQYRPMATTVTKVGFFGFGKRTKVEPVVEPPENPLVDEYLATAMEDEYRGLSRGNSVRTSLTTVRSSILEPGTPGSNAWQDEDALSVNNGSTSPYRPSSSASRNPPYDPPRLTAHSRTTSTISSNLSLSTPQQAHKKNLSLTNKEILTSNRSLQSINPKDLLPGEMNHYAGFCKGAWRQQIGDRKKAMEERVRPGGVYNAARFWQCKQCKFEGRLVPKNTSTAVPNKRNNKTVGSSGYDTRVFQLCDGIQFRWEFLFKSHIPTKDLAPVLTASQTDPTAKATYGCVFCCAEGVRCNNDAGSSTTAPVYKGLKAFMQHLVEHRERLPTGEVLYRMNCLVGRRAGVEEDFDVNIVSLEGGAF